MSVSDVELEQTLATVAQFPVVALVVFQAFDDLGFTGLNADHAILAVKIHVLRLVALEARTKFKRAKVHVSSCQLAGYRSASGLQELDCPRLAGLDAMCPSFQAVSALQIERL